MATISGNVCNSYVHIDLIITEMKTNVDGNLSEVMWKLVGYLGSGASSSHWYSNSYHSINVSINGSTVYSLPNTTQKLISIGTSTSASSPVTIASGSTTVPHNSDGSKTCACSFSVVYKYNSAFAWNLNDPLKMVYRSTKPTVQKDVKSENHNIIEGETLILSAMNVNMSKRRSESVDIQQLPKGYSVNDIVFDTNDVSIVSIDKNGTLTVNKEGYTIVHAKPPMVNIR